MKKLIAIALLLFVVMAALVRWSVAAAETSFFEVEAVDTMKYSRDAARNKEAQSFIPAMVVAAAALHPTHIAIATPYDDEFIPITKLWVNEIRKRNIKVWYRGNFAAWENWFGYPRFTDPYEHIAKSERFIKNNPDLFENGDIFTPAPEAENGGFGDPRKSEEIKQKFFDFLPRSYESCVNSMKTIGKNAKCGYFSVNGDVAKMFTKDIVDRTGGVLVIDHYVKTPEELIKDIQAYHETTGGKIVLGEYGAPIPDIHGNLSEEEQDKLIRENLIQLVKHRDIIGGINYWTAFGGSTEIFRERINPKKAAKTLEEYFNPMVVKGKVQDELGGAVRGALVENDIAQVKTNSSGNYSLLTTPDFLEFEVIHPEYETKKVKIAVLENEKNYTENVEVKTVNPGFWYQVRKFFHSLTTFTFY